MHDYDVAIVGASIGGCTAATLLARQGASVALIESHSEPSAHKHLCTHYFQPTSLPVLERLGVLDQLHEAGGVDSALNLWTRAGWLSPSADGAGGKEHNHSGLNVRREVIDPVMRSLAASEPRVTLLLGHTATELIQEDGRVGGVLVRARNGTETEIRTQLVIAADGRYSATAKLAGVRTKARKNNRFGYMAYYRDTRLVTGDDAQLWLMDPDAAYAFPTDSGLTLLACMPHKRRQAEFKADPEAAMAAQFEQLPDGPRIDPAKRTSQVFGFLDLPNVSRRTHIPGLAFVGDASMAADPLAGVGCGWALLSASWLSEEVAPVLGEGDRAVDRATKRYRQRHRKALAGHNRMISANSVGWKFDPLFRAMLRAAVRDQALANRFLELIAGWRSPTTMIRPAALYRMTMVNLGRAGDSGPQLRTDGAPQATPPGNG